MQWLTIAGARLALLASLLTIVQHVAPDFSINCTRPRDGIQGNRGPNRTPRSLLDSEQTARIVMSSQVRHGAVHTYTSRLNKLKSHSPYGGDVLPRPRKEGAASAGHARAHAVDSSAPR
ncbi:unnamed protein product [Periconia digitata]|uniref:Secreted protein n=1 Tax=Periconia digitata TaxID=1303443 RepID=A0A9W4UMT8_9PLEO|nr:unnamed protein product [Periconia digitata]